MNISKCKKNVIGFLDLFTNSKICRCFSLIFIALVFRVVFLVTFRPSLVGVQQHNFAFLQNESSSSHLSYSKNANGVRKDKFLEVPQIAWGLNNQKIAVARAFLTARMLNRTLLLPSLSASLFYKEINLLQPIAFDKIFQYEKFNSLCSEFVQLGRFSDLSNKTDVLDLTKGSGRKWTIERDLDQLRKFREDPISDGFEVIRIIGKNPFLWHDHWPVKDYAKIFECLVFVNEITEEAEKVVTKIREIGSTTSTKTSSRETPYVAVHMRIEKDWMIHCKNLERKYNVRQICSSKGEIIDRVGHIIGLTGPTVVYLAVADDLLEDGSVLSGWREDILPFEKKKLGVWDIYKKYPYLIQSAIDYEVCLRADIFVGNSFSTFSSLIVLERTQKLIRMGVKEGFCETGNELRWSSYAYNILGESGGAKKWMTNMSNSSLRAISYGTNNILC